MDTKILRERRQKLERLVEQMRTERVSFKQDWMDVSSYLMPTRSRFLVTDRNKGKRWPKTIVDSHASRSADRARSGMMSGLSSPSRPWFKLGLANEMVQLDRDAKIWLEVVTNQMREVFLKSNLYNSLPIVYIDMLCYGVNATAIMEDDEDVIRCVPLPVGSYMFACNQNQRVDVVAREYQMTARQMVDEFGEDAVTPQVKASAKNQSESWWDVVHVIYPNSSYESGAMGADGKRYRSCYYQPGSVEGEKVFLRESGYDEWPFMTPRWDVTGEDIYGLSPGMMAMGDIKALQIAAKRLAQLTDKITNPPLVGPTALKGAKVSLLPGDVTYVDSMGGTPSLRPIFEPNPQAMQMFRENIAMYRRAIDEAFYIDLFLMISNDERGTPPTAEEIIERRSEKMLMLGPVVERLGDEAFSPLIDRTFGVMLRRGMIPEPPDSIQGQDIQVEYTSVMAQAQKLVSTSGLERFMNLAMNSAKLFPDITDVVSSDEALRQYAEMLSVSPTLLNDAAKIAAIRKQRADQQAAMVNAEVAERMAKAAKSASQAETTGDNLLTEMMP